MSSTECRYCGNKLPKNNNGYDVCYKCTHKLKLVRKLLAIGRKIKERVQK